ncbi:MAG: hypothetical protein ACFE9Z_04995 [Promethearchaeota archaeon]
MEIVFGKINNKAEVKRDIQKTITCPYCKMLVKIGIEYGMINKISPHIFFPHIHLHGDPLHALICYISPNLQVRNVSVIKSIEIARDSTTFAQLMKKWTNPY